MEDVSDPETITARAAKQPLNLTVQGCFVDVQVFFPDHNIFNFEQRFFGAADILSVVADGVNRQHRFEKENEMASRGSSLATAFIWAVSMAAGFGIGESFVLHEKSDQVAGMGVAASVAAVAGYSVRRRSPS